MALIIALACILGILYAFWPKQPKPMAYYSDYYTEATVEDGYEDIVTLVDEEGESHDFQVVDIIEVNGREYAMLLPAESEDPEQDEVLVLRFEEDRFEMIEDEAEFQAVVAVLESLVDDD